MPHEPSDLLADELHDLRLNEDGEVEVGGDGDLRITHDIETVEQSVRIHASEAVRTLIGEPLTDAQLEDIQTQLRRVLQNDPQLANVRRVEVTEINRSTSTVSVRVFVDNNNSFEIGVTA